MIKRTEPPKDAPPAHREQCYVCRRAKKNCLCGSVKPFSTRMRFVVLMHEEEARKQKTGTGRLACMCLTNAELLVGVDFSGNERVNALISDPACSPFLLYPGPEAVDFGALGKDAAPPGKTLVVFVVDGTWRTARSLLSKSPNVRALPRLSFSRGYRSRFAIKRQPMQHCVSTIEAIYHLCAEAQEAGYEKLDGRSGVLLEILEKIVGTQLQFANGKGRKREENKRKNA